MGDSAYRGMQRVETQADPRNAQDFIVRQVMNGMATSTLVMVVSVTNSGDVSAAGSVDVQPLVGQLTGSGDIIDHGVLYALPYARLQGGASAVIIDPKPGDIGIALFASSDISTVKATKAAGPPGSRRKFDMADGLYLGGVLNGTPTQYVRFTDAGDIEVVSPLTVTVRAPAILLDGEVTVTGDVIADGISLKTHRHTGVTTGGGTSGTPTP